MCCWTRKRVLTKINFRVVWSDESIPTAWELTRLKSQNDSNFGIGKRQLGRDGSKLLVQRKNFFNCLSMKGIFNIYIKYMILVQNILTCSKFDFYSLSRLCFRKSFCCCFSHGSCSIFVGGMIFAQIWSGLKQNRSLSMARSPRTSSKIV